MSVLTQDDRFEEMQNGAKGEVKTVCEVLDNAISKGRIEGRAEGKAEGIQAMVESCQELGVSAEAVKMQLVKKFSMTEQEAQQKLELYWKWIKLQYIKLIPYRMQQKCSEEILQVI